MIGATRVTYLLALIGLPVAGFFVEASWWAEALAGIGVMVPVAAMDIITSRRRQAMSAAGA